MKTLPTLTTAALAAAATAASAAPLVLNDFDDNQNFTFFAQDGTTSTIEDVDNDGDNELSFTPSATPNFTTFFRSSLTQAQAADVLENGQFSIDLIVDDAEIDEDIALTVRLNQNAAGPQQIAINPTPTSGGNADRFLVTDGQDTNVTLTYDITANPDAQAAFQAFVDNGAGFFELQFDNAGFPGIDTSGDVLAFDNFVSNPIPEPTAAAAAGLLGLVALRRRSRK